MLTFLFVSLFAHSSFASDCKVVEQSWSHEPNYCQKRHFPQENVYRCYAVLEANGQRVKVWGSECWPTSYDCSFGEGKVDACE